MTDSGKRSLILAGDIAKGEIFCIVGVTLRIIVQELKRINNCSFNMIPDGLTPAAPAKVISWSLIAREIQVLLTKSYPQSIPMVIITLNQARLTVQMNQYGVSAAHVHIILIQLLILVLNGFQMEIH